jgi:hypothetical protein
VGIALAAERQNLTTAFEWAALSGRWAEAAELIAGAYPLYLLSGAALEARQLTQRALAATVDQRGEQADMLRAAMAMTSVWLTDWVTFIAVAQELTRSPRAFTRVIGHAGLGVTTPFADAGSSSAHFAQARRELALAADDLSDSDRDALGGLIRWVEGRVAAAAGDLQAGFDGCMEHLATCRSIDYYPTTTPRAARLAAVCQILLGDPDAALATLVWFQTIAPDFRTDDIRSLALLGQGRLADAAPLVRSVATEGLSGRMPMQVCDSVALLAALTHAEGDVERTRELLCRMGAGLDPGIIILSRHLAQRCESGPSTRPCRRRRSATGRTARRATTAYCWRPRPCGRSSPGEVGFSRPERWPP